MNVRGASASEGLVINWAMTTPPPIVKNWFAWDAGASLADHPLEPHLGWPSGTIDALHQAFSRKLSRSTGWKLEALQNREKSAAQKAAQIFRRGVQVFGEAPLSLNGTYPVRIVDADPYAILYEYKGAAVLDQNVAKLWCFRTKTQDHVLDLTEQTKSLATVSSMIHWISQTSGPISVVGGGILADTAAFAAALCNREFRLIPTTLLAMLDACVGGKTGVNFEPFGKNQLGLFAFPTEVLIVPRFLNTLPEREFKAGLAEGFKHALIRGDKDLSAKVAALPPTPEAVRPFLKELIEVKAEIIEEDPNETGKRAVLNLGHTLAHALEKISQETEPDDPILHGEAVGIGLYFALYLSHGLKMLPDETFTALEKLLLGSTFLMKPIAFQKHMGLGRLSFDSFIDALLEGLAQDKKNQEGGATEWVILKDWGEFAQNGATYTIPVQNEKARGWLRGFFMTKGYFPAN